MTETAAPKKPQIRWSKAERTAVVGRLAECMAADWMRLVPDGSDRGSSQRLMDHLRTAQVAMLPAGRRRLANMHRGFLGKDGLRELEASLATILAQHFVGARQSAGDHLKNQCKKS